MVIVLITSLSLTACAQTSNQVDTTNKNYPTPNSNNKVKKSSKEWKKLLTDEEYRVLREQGTERAFTGEFYDHHDSGMYTCAACGLELFSSVHKFESGTGWPSYWQPINESNVEETMDDSYGMVRSEVHCARCGGHLGHVFEDGPEPTGLRYCINSVSLDFKAAARDSQEIKTSTE